MVSEWLSRQPWNQQESAMTMECLRHLAMQTLPYEVLDPAEVNNLSILRAADLIAAFIPPPNALSSGPASYPPPKVLAITEKGRRALQEVLGTEGL
jgi:hypothetical protein